MFSHLLRIWLDSWLLCLLKFLSCVVYPCVKAADYLWHPFCLYFSFLAKLRVLKYFKRFQMLLFSTFSYQFSIGCVLRYSKPFEWHIANTKNRLVHPPPHFLSVLLTWILKHKNILQNFYFIHLLCIFLKASHIFKVLSFVTSVVCSNIRTTNFNKFD